MGLAQAVAEIAEHCGRDPRELREILDAVNRSDVTWYEFVRLAKFLNREYSGKAWINFDGGMITDARIETSFKALARLLESKAG